MDKKLVTALAPIVLLIGLLSVNVMIFGDGASSGANQLALLCAAFLSLAIGVFYLKVPYKTIEGKTFNSIGVALPAIAILLVVGALIGLWLLSGVVPAMIYYGVQLINPTFFLPVTMIICSIVSLATGSSWSTVGTVGIALIGIGTALGIPLSMVAGAIVSGSYFGDKMSALSDTTNLAPAMAGVDLFEHIQNMMHTTWPAYILSLLAFTVLGFFSDVQGGATTDVQTLLTLIDSHFWISPWLFTLPLIIFFLVYKKVPALPALALGAFLGAIYAVIFQPEVIKNFTEEALSLKTYYVAINKAAYGGFELNSGNTIADDLLSRGGMEGMLGTIWLIFSAMIFGGVMEATGMLESIANALLRMVRGVSSLISTTVFSGIFLNLTTSDQYISIVLSGRMFKKAFEERGLPAKHLSRSVEDGATVTSVLVPWNTCGAYFAGVMGVATLEYLPFAFFNLLTPVCSIAIALWMGPKLKGK